MMVAYGVVRVKGIGIVAQVVQKVSPAVVRARIHATPEEIAAFCRAHHIRWLALFGSVLRDDFRDESDIDVLYAPESGRGIERFAVAEELARLFATHEVDFICFADLKWRIRDRVYAETETLYGDAPEEVQHAKEMRPYHDFIAVKDENLYVGDMLDTAKRANRIVSGRTRDDYDADELFQLAVLHLVQTIGEAASHVSHTTRAAYPGIPWTDIIAMRNIVVHGYDSVNGDKNWDVLTIHLSPLVAELERMLPPEMQAEP